MKQALIFLCVVAGAALVYLLSQASSNSEQFAQHYLPLLEPSETRAGDELAVKLRSDTSMHAGMSARWRVRHGRGGRAREQALDIRKGYLG